MNLIVLMQNDYPVGIYTDEEKADLAAKEHYERHYQRIGTGRQMSDYHYRQYEFVVNGRAK